jgi:two-component sensor histidine kinase
MRKRLNSRIVATPEWGLAQQLLVGLIVGTAAAGVRLVLPLEPYQIPTLPVVVALAVVTTFVGPWAGFATALVGGSLCLFALFGPQSASPAPLVPLISFLVIASTILITASFYRTSERERYRLDLLDARRETEDAVLFAREMGHRLKNALAVVQSLAFQTIGLEDERGRLFAARLRTLADANQLLSEHLSKPVASADEVVASALAPFHSGTRLITEIAPARLPDEQVVSLALALHELATNATKYGAWSNTAGIVHLLLRDEGETLRMTWTERGGPPVRAPERSGFGQRLLERAGKSPSFNYHPEGLQFEALLRKA